MIEIALFPEMLDALSLLRGTKLWDEQKDHAPLMQWMKEMLEWLQTSRMGKLEMSRPNNHGVWYHQTVLGLALHADNKEVCGAVFFAACVFACHGYGVH